MSCMRKSSLQARLQGPTHQCDLVTFNQIITGIHFSTTQVTGFDSVDDESKPEHLIFTLETNRPPQWVAADNPPYSYYVYYMYANLVTLNQLRRFVVVRCIQVAFA